MSVALETRTVAKDYSPRPVVSPIQITDAKSMFVVRDDLLVAGTKQRAIIPYLKGLIEEGHNHFIYASPFSGFAQIALAYACKELGAQCTLFCEKESGEYVHEFSKIAKSFGARLILCHTLADAQAKSQSYAALQNRVKLIPLGFNSVAFRTLLEEEISRHWWALNSVYKIKELWLPIGSGTLLNVFKRVVGAEVKLVGVNVNVLPEADQRIASIAGDQRVTYLRSPQRFHDPCQDLPPVPSNLYYDAKLFSFFEEHAADGAFWWNVAR